MVNYQILIGGEDYTEYCALPFKEQYVLDSALDNGVLTLPMTNRNGIFKPFTPVDITKDSDTYRMYVASDKMIEIVGAGKYTHELVLIEETKLLEKKVVDTNTTTQPLIHDYLALAIKVQPTIVHYNVDVPSQDIDFYTPSKLGDTLNLGSLDQAYSGLDTYPYVYGTGTISVAKDGVVVDTHTILLANLSTEYTYTPTEEGEYTIRYYAFMGIDPNGSSEVEKTYTLQIIKQPSKRTDKSITDVVNRLLAITETLRVGETPKLKFNQEQAEFYDQRKQTWLINDIPDVSSVINYDIKFTSNNTDYITFQINPQGYLIYAYGSGAQSDLVYMGYNQTWTDNAYKTVIFNEKIPDELKTWLNANATLISEELLYPAPEFSMTKSTLRECLDQVGSYIHSIVRLVGDTIYFDKLGGTTETNLDEDYIGNYETLDCEQYASQLDSIVSNLTNIDDEATGTIIEPFKDVYRTVRAETGTIRIGDGQNESTAIIETDYPIEKIAKLECGYITVNGNSVLVGDITPYVYEKDEYDLLSSNSGTYPLSKGYAITYTQGQKNITGLLFKLPNAVSSIFSNQAILNIISQKIGQSVQSAFSVQDITELQFRLTYYPSTTARVKQSRTDINNYSMDLTSIYNQSANKVDSRAYGENLKGAIARLGNINKFITYTTKTPNNLLNVGNYVIINNEDYYIATLSVDNEIDHTKYTIGLSKDFNAISKYIGIKNNIRLYEVSEKQSVERHIIYEDYCVIGNAITEDSKQIITSNAVNLIAEQLTTPSNTQVSTTVARVQGTDIDGNPLAEVDLPVISLGLGNSIWLGFKYADNYSAGSQSVDPSSDNIGAYYRLNQFVRYTDYFGEIETLSINMYNYLDSVDSSNAVSVGNALPQATLTAQESPYISTASDDIVVKKDNREQINFAYQMHFVSNDGLIIGTQLSQGSPLVSNFNDTYAELYVLPTRINKFASDIDLTNAVLIKSYENATSPDIVINSSSIEFGNQAISGVSGKSWALVDKASGKLLFGKNIVIGEDDIEIVMPTMTFTHKY